MQTLDVISVNLWQILISLLNLYLLFLIVKFFLFKPVKNVLAKRQQELDARYASAAEAERAAHENQRSWEEKISHADTEANAILQSAAEQAKFRGDAIIADARSRADSIIRVAQDEAEQERRKAVDDVKREIVEVSGVLSQKILEREINTEDHRKLIESFIETVGDGNE